LSRENLSTRLLPFEDSVFSLVDAFVVGTTVWVVVSTNVVLAASLVRSVTVVVSVAAGGCVVEDDGVDSKTITPKPEKQAIRFDSLHIFV